MQRKTIRQMVAESEAVDESVRVKAESLDGLTEIDVPAVETGALQEDEQEEENVDDRDSDQRSDIRESNESNSESPEIPLASEDERDAERSVPEHDGDDASDDTSDESVGIESSSEGELNDDSEFANTENPVTDDNQDSPLPPEDSADDDSPTVPESEEDLSLESADDNDDSLSTDDTEDTSDYSSVHDDQQSTFDNPQPPELELDELPSLPSDEPAELTDTEDQQSANQPDLIGFQGVTFSSPISQSSLDKSDLSDPSLTSEERSQKQYEFAHNFSESLASDLARELDPAFDEMRDHSTNTVHTYVQQQALITSMLRAR